MIKKILFKTADNSLNVVETGWADGDSQVYPLVADATSMSVVLDSNQELVAYCRGRLQRWLDWCIGGNASPTEHGESEMAQATQGTEDVRVGTDCLRANKLQDLH